MARSAHLLPHRRRGRRLMMSFAKDRRRVRTHEPSPYLHLVGTAGRLLAAGPLPTARPGAGRDGYRADRATRASAARCGASLPDDAPRTGDGGDEPPGPGVRVPD